MPFLGKSWIDGLETVRRTYDLAYTVWAAPSTGSISHSSLPLMTFTAYPPHFLVRLRGNIFGSQATVLRGVPFFGKNRIDGLEAVVFTYGFPRTVWAAITLTPATYGSLPLMALATHPPDFSVGPCGNVCGSQASVPRGVPFFGKSWINGLEAVVFINGFSYTIWASSPTASLIDGSLPFVTLAAYPPDLLIGT